MRAKFGKPFVVFIVAAVAAAAVPAVRAENNLIGAGVNYWRTVDNLGGGIDRDGLSWLVSYQRNLNRLMALQADLEWFRRGFAGAGSDVFAPQGFLLLGGALYGGIGIGILYADGEFNDKPYYALRAGLDIEILPTVHLDVHANYQFTEWEKINTLEKDLGSDTITLGAAVRIEF